MIKEGSTCELDSYRYTSLYNMPSLKWDKLTMREISLFVEHEIFSKDKIKKHHYLITVEDRKGNLVYASVTALIEEREAKNFLQIIHRDFDPIFYEEREMFSACAISRESAYTAKYQRIIKNK